MSRLMSVCVCLLFLAGCQEKKGFEPGDVHFSQMGVDVAYRLKASYLPAKTTFAFVGDESQVFNAALTGKLREMGYGVNEDGKVGMPLKARIIRLGERGAVVIVDVGDGQLQRGFDLLDGDISPNSYWMARRDGDGGR